MRNTRNAIAAIAIASTAGIASADVFFGDVAGSSEQTGATYSGNLVYEHISGSVGELTITLTNDTPASVGGRLTAIVFRFDTVDGSAWTSLISSTISGMTNTGTVNGAPYGTFKGGAGTGGQFEGGGPASNGLAIGATATFVWKINASDAASLNEMSFLNASNSPGILARFRGLTGGGSDKVPGVIPAPAPIALAGLAGLVATRRRRN
ncbi:MAG: hypothetical protein KF705_02375 [Phycisphaeraceae bacterium]|nr:hypothetical protein [Phycisphaeraceae bacterium]